MTVKVSKDTRAELVGAIAGRYRSGSRAEKQQILVEFVAVTGYHRKHAIRLLNAERGIRTACRGGRRRVYDEAVREALVVLWEASDRVCGKRLRPLLGILVPALERHGHLRLDAVVRERLMGVSAATIDRMLAPTRLAARGEAKKSRRTTPGIRRSVPIRTFGDWGEPSPGYMEVDLVAHCGGDASGSFVNTLVLTDIASGWTECVPLLVRDSALVVEALTRLRVALPFCLRGIDTDNGSEFINETVLAYCASNSIELTRSRPYRKNDQAWVEQKNGAVVRRMVGYHRLEGVAAAEVLSRLYAASRLFVNFFQPSFKLAEKLRVGARVSKRYHPPETPCSRLLAFDAVADQVRGRLTATAHSLDPLGLLDEIRTQQQRIAGLAAGENSHFLPHRDVELETFFRGLATAWREGEVRPTHRQAPKPGRNWRTHKDAFEAVWPIVREWLEQMPDITAKDLLARLREDLPGEFSGCQLRTLQRRLREWRSAKARELVFAERPDLALQLSYR